MTLQVTASSGTTMSYQWQKNGTNISNAKNSSYTLSNVQLTDQAAYSVNIMNAGGTTTSSNAILTVTNVAPQITTQPQNQAFNNNDNATLSITAQGTEPLSYQWMLNGTNIPGATNSTLSYNQITTNQAGLYTVMVSNVVGTVTSSTAVVTVQAPPYILAQPQSQSVLLGLAATFSVSALSKSGISYQWYYNGSPVGGATSSNLTLLNLLGTQAGYYWVVLKNAVGSTTSAVAALDVTAIPPSISAQPQSEALASGSKATFSVTASGSSPLGYQWTLNGTNLAGATGSSLTLKNITTNNTGNYAVVITNFLGTVTSSVAVLTVDAPPYILSQPQSVVVASGLPTSMSVTAMGLGALNYQWYDTSGTAISGATSATLSTTNATPNMAGSYYVVVSNPQGSTTSQVANVTVLVPPTINTSPQTQSAIVGQNVNLNVAVTGTSPFNYQWYFNGAPLAGATTSNLSLNAVQMNNSGNYHVIVSNVLGSATSGTALVTITSPPTVTPVGMTPNGFGFQFPVPVGRTYVIQASTNLVSWIPISTNLATTGTASFIDPASVYNNRCYYRVQLQ